MSECVKWSWQISGYDELVHAFRSPGGPAGFLEAACSHSVPVSRVSRNHCGPRCVACLLIVGEHLTGPHRLGIVS